MARSPTRMLTGSTLKFLYETVEDVPWTDIQIALERATGQDHPGFSDEDKREIFVATEIYAGELIEPSEVLFKKDLQKARAEILKGLKDMRLLASRFLGAARDDNDGKALTALQMIHGTEDLNIRNALAQVGRSAANLEDHLEASPEISEDDLDHIKESSRCPKVVALEAFLKDVLFDAEKVPARSNPGYLDVPERFEFTRWNIPVGPRNKIFRAFCNALLKEELSEDQIRNAWPRGKVSRFETLGEIVDRNLKGGK